MNIQVRLKEELTFLYNMALFIFSMLLFSKTCLCFLSKQNYHQSKSFDPMATSELVQHFPHSYNTNTSRLSNFNESLYKHLLFVALLPSQESDNKNDCVLPKVLPVLELAIRHVQNLGFARNAQIDITLISRDTNCSSIHGPIGFFEIYMQWPEVNAVFGLPCEYVLAPISRYAGVWQIPVFTSGGNAADFSNKGSSYPTLTRLKGAQANNLGNAVRAIIDSFNWTRTSLIYQNEHTKIKGNSVCFFCIAVVHDKLHAHNASVYQQAFDTERWGKLDIARMLLTIAKQSRIVIMCADPQSIRQIMLTAEELNMVDSGEYVFINIELFSRATHLTSQPWFDKNDSLENNRRARNAYTAMLTVTPKQPNNKEYIELSNKIKIIAAEKYNYIFNVNESISAFVTSFFDGVLLYANALNKSIEEDPNVLKRPINGTDMIRRMWHRSFMGITDNVSIDGNGDRVSAYSLLDLNPITNRFDIVAHFHQNRLEFVSGKCIHWPGNRQKPPRDNPICGYDGSLCLDNSLPAYAILSLVLGIVVIIMSVCFFLGYRYYKSESEINSMSWNISSDEVIFYNSTGIRDSFHALVKYSSRVTLISDDIFPLSSDRQIFIPVGSIRGCKAVIKTIGKNVNLTRSLMLELKHMKDLQHDHLVKFYGACLEPQKSFILTEYCPKGSLQDILQNEQFQLDWMFKLSLIHDIVRGMQFLHYSDIKSHGNLKSSNCVVDSRFVLKICDFGLHTLRRRCNYAQHNVENCYNHAFWSKLLWTAPELLKLENNRPPEGTQKGDVYSFAIIVHEIVVRQGPFDLGHFQEDKSAQEIIQLVKGYHRLTPLPYRPELVEVSSDYKEVNSIMQKCWSEDPNDRPDFNHLKCIIKNINKHNETGNILDNLLKRMELYANNLEDVVEERTRDYIEEKKKCEKLLYQLLPQSVAAQLISGLPVVAETFDSVTIYFSDIVGFTYLSAESTPMEVVQFLNDLYICFDSIVENFDVYKVETIGDAYMVVSGLPLRNGNKHAPEIARMSLALLEAVHNFKIRHRPNDHLKLRIGLHTGACVAGVVGLKMPRYCLFGDTVNTASRMESNGEALKIHISESTKRELDVFGNFITTCRGSVLIKGKGEMLTYWLEAEVPNAIIPTFKFSRRYCLEHNANNKYSEKQIFVDSCDRISSNIKHNISTSLPKINNNHFIFNDSSQSLNEKTKDVKMKTSSIRLPLPATVNNYANMKLHKSEYILNNSLLQLKTTRVKKKHSPNFIDLENSCSNSSTTSSINRFKRKKAEHTEETEHLIRQYESQKRKNTHINNSADVEKILNKQIQLAANSSASHNFNKYETLIKFNNITNCKLLPEN